MFLPSMLVTIVLVLSTFHSNTWAQAPSDYPAQPSISSDLGAIQALKTSRLSPISRLEGIQFVNNSTSQILLERDGKKYLIDTQTKTIHEVIAETTGTTEKASSGSSDEAAQESKEKKEEKEVYYTEDINLWTLPTTHHLEKKALIVDFTHRFAFDDGRAFKGQAMNNLFGLDGYSFSSFGLTYGITDTFFVGAYRVPTGLGRIIELYGGAQLLQEAKGHPFSSTFRVAVEGANHFRENYVTSLELALARSIKKRAQVYLVPSLSFNARPLVTAFDQPPPKVDGENTMAIGAGISIDFRPTVAFIAEGIIRTGGLLEEPRHPAFMFGVQKKIYRHSFTLGVSNSPGTTVSLRSATRTSLGLDSSISNLTIGFNLSRRLF
ncbi:MAG: hypothetical protein DMG05_12670 [Acidobacteria bacterium]|nr:MAG: hypothetical protein DMG05_12670 [Acidobacteriota bacterium]